ncbi:hypothetical protein PF010_g11138 [Phytophthora fragariae]|uniref:Uncharacterized protein n=1 Tax=Phytophthora fragariae TaxID=53985 RepID=A0A6A3KUI9_9STRA|nr:hypothetical protein PF011_g10477 [Phytophthora fragariae]KAE9110488.1 hypothetical protein PF010_g11138 [Phytophthora fragariae]KAE9232811.1 hypothetical protein PF004_g9825 [Phytophthora fragariae]
MARTVPVAPKPKLFDEYEMPSSAAHKARIRLLQTLVKEQTVEQRYMNVGQKRRFRAAFDDVAWEQNLRRVYEDAGDHQLKQLAIDPMPLNEPSFELLLATLSARCAGSARVVSRLSATRRSSAESTGRVDLLRDGEKEKAVVVERKEHNFDVGVAQGALVAETALLERLEKDPEMKENVYGIVSDFLTWQLMELSVDGARFCKFVVDENKKEVDLRQIVGALAALLQGKESREA